MVASHAGRIGVRMQKAEDVGVSFGQSMPNGPPDGKGMGSP
jgi:hypothetical protein